MKIHSIFLVLLVGLIFVGAFAFSGCMSQEEGYFTGGAVLDLNTEDCDMEVVYCEDACLDIYQSYLGTVYESYYWECMDDCEWVYEGCIVGIEREIAERYYIEREYVYPTYYTVYEPEPEKDHDTLPPQDIRNGYVCGYSTYNCAGLSDKEAQIIYETCGGLGNDVHELDRDGDGFACGNEALKNGYICHDNVYDCNDFDTQTEAQNVYEICGGLDNDVHNLDSDRDGLACEYFFF